ncbi:MAG: alpha-amylase family glycosyl hydrolase [Kiritimatiellia bacterium]
MLPARPIHGGQAGIVQRSFKYGSADFTRLYRDEPLALTVTINSPDAANPLVTLHTDIGAPEPGAWREIPFESEDQKSFTLKLTVPSCGLFRYRVKYSLNGGAKWFWDRVPHSYVLVDPPSLRTVRFYTLIPSASGTITDWTALLPGLKAMGFDTLHLLPITPMGASQSPYAARDLFGVDDRYRDPAKPGSALDQLEDFVVECRRTGIRLCFDLVLNHISSDSDMVNACPDWIVPDDAQPDGFKRAGCWHQQKWISWEDLVAIHYDHPIAHVRRGLWDYMKQYALFWSNYAAYTGGMVRFDNLHSSRGAFIAELSAAIRQQHPDLAILGEYFTDELTLEKTVPEWGINLLLANSWEHPFGPALRHYIEYLHKVGGRLRHLCSVTTHDTGVPAQLFGADRSVVPRYAICALFTTGQTGLTQGAEAGVAERVPFIGPPYRLDLTAGPDFRPAVAAINALLAEHPVLREAGNLAFVDNGHPAVLGACRKPRQGGGNSFLLLANLDIHGVQHIGLDLAARGLPVPCVLEDQFSGERLDLQGHTLQLSLPPCGIKAFLIRPV